MKKSLVKPTISALICSMLILTACSNSDRSSDADRQTVPVNHPSTEQSDRQETEPLPAEELPVTKTLEEFAASEEITEQLATLTNALQNQEIRIGLSCKDNKLIYSYTYLTLTKQEGMAEFLSDEVANKKDKFQKTVAALSTEVSTDNPVIVVEYLDRNDEIIYTQEFSVDSMTFEDDASYNIISILDGILPIDALANSSKIDYNNMALLEELGTNNVFYGTINGEPVIGYLYYSYKYYLDRLNDYNASFLIFNSDGTPAGKVGIRIYETVTEGIYSNSENTELSVNIYYDATVMEDLTVRDSYSNVWADTWSVEITEADYSGLGSFAGTIDATLVPPEEYCSYPGTGEAIISGTFQFQMNTIHAVAKQYRDTHSDIVEDDSIYEIVYGNIPSGISSGISSGSSSPDFSSENNYVDHTCRTCHGSGQCNGCAGRGWKQSSANGKVIDCTRCKGTGVCTVCYGTGKIY